jgi:hypothetical protein
MRIATWLVPLAALGLPATPQAGGTVLTLDDAGSSFLFTRPFPTDGRAWFGVFSDGDGSRIAPVDVHWTAELDAGDSTFALILSTDVPTLLVADVPGIRPGPVMAVFPFAQPLTAEERSQTIALGTTTYALTLGGSDPMLCDATVALSDGTRSQPLYSAVQQVFSCDEAHFAVDWAGDLDGDGRLDLVTTFSPKYSVFPRRLYLSTAAAAGDLVGLVAAYDAAD